MSHSSRVGTLQTELPSVIFCNDRSGKQYRSLKDNIVVVTTSCSRRNLRCVLVLCKGLWWNEIAEDTNSSQYWQTTTPTTDSVTSTTLLDPSTKTLVNMTESRKSCFTLQLLNMLWMSRSADKRWWWWRCICQYIAVNCQFRLERNSNWSESTRPVLD